MTNIYIFWSKSADPPVPWIRLTRQLKYVRCTNSYSNHLASVGATTHAHTSTGFDCSYNLDYVSVRNSDYQRMANHKHGSPSFSVASANNTPPGYGLDIIYMDLDTWEASVRCFPEGAVIASSGALTEDLTISRFTAADGKFIYNDAPGNAVGGSTAHSHAMTGTSAAAGGSGTDTTGGYTPRSYAPSPNNHTHTMDVTSTSATPEPAYIQTRLYEALAKTKNAQAGAVVFLDGAATSKWSVLSDWNGRSLKSGNSDPTTGGSDTHSHTYDGYSSTYNGDADWSASYAGSCVAQNHNHEFWGTLAKASNVPSSIQLYPVKLLITLEPISGGGAQIIGLDVW